MSCFTPTSSHEIFSFPYTTLFRSLHALVVRTNQFHQITLQMVGDHLQNVGEVLALGGEFHHFFLLCLGHGHATRSEEHTSELQSLRHLVCRLLLEKKKNTRNRYID